MCVPTSSDKPVFTKAPRSKSAKFSRADVALHNRKEDCWVIVENKVYDVTDFVESHPGGEILILDVAGRDVTDPFLANHPSFVPEKYLPLMQVGVVSDPVEPVESVKRYRALFRKFHEEGWFHTNYFYFARKISVYLSLLAATFYFVLNGNWLPGAVTFGWFFQQVAFFGHDLGHNAVTHNRNGDWVLGLIFGPLLSGVSIGWWKATHNVHHLVTNSVEYDPDIQHLPVFAVCNGYFKDVYSYYHERVFEFSTSPLTQWFVKRQHFLYVPIMLLARFNLYIQSLLLCLNKKEAKKRGIFNPMREIAAMGVFWGWLIWLVSQIPSFWEQVAFLLISHGIGGILHLQITISHFPMPTISKEEGQTFSECENFVQHQLDTSMDVSCPRWMDWFHGGLQFQAVHHLYPRMPRHRLRAASYLVKDMYYDHPNGVEYKAEPFFKCLEMTLSTLKVTAHEVGDFMNAIG
jgi:delta8-fatty-acid desaturase